MDCRGHGKSDKPQDAASYGDEMAFDVVRLMEHLGIEKAHVAGYSMGGFITSKLLILHAERIKSAVIGGAGWIDVNGKWGEMLDDVAVSLETGKGFLPLLESLQPTSGAPMPQVQVQGLSRLMLLTNDPKAVSQVARGLKRLSIPLEEFRKVNVPVLAIVGARDPLKEAADAVSTVIPDIEKIVLEGQDHISTPFSKSFADAVKAFFDGQK
jgi:pimeloyl-ACP methyl ester carboxylesterase